MRYRSMGRWRRSPESRSTPKARWWAVIDLCDDVGRYYRSLFNWHNRAGKTLMKPAWDEHITVVRNEEPPNKVGWWDMSDSLVEFEYEPRVEFNGKHAWLPVFCQEALLLREHLELPREPEYPLHLTIGVANSSLKI